jgi:hypothetical protein
MANKYLTLISGRDTLKEATVISAGGANAGELVALDASGKIDETVLPSSIVPDVKVLETTEALSAGNYVNIYNATGTVKCRLADNSNDRPAMGYVKTSYSSGATTVKVYFEGANSNLSALTLGARYYLGTAGAPTATPVTAGIHQFLGIAISATEINTDIDDEIVIA